MKILKDIDTNILKINKKGKKMTRSWRILEKNDASKWLSKQPTVEFLKKSMNGGTESSFCGDIIPGNFQGQNM